MSDLSIAVERSRSQLSVTSYFDEDLFRKEQALIFESRPRYLGHELSVPEVGDFHVLSHEGDGRALVRTPSGVECISNVCRHRQAIMLKGAGSLPGGTITCPLHRWSYDGEGKLLGTPSFPEKVCLDLPRQDLQKWNGMLFNGKRDVARDLARLGVASELDLAGYHLKKVETVEYDFNWKTFIEVYLEDYHVGPFHPGLGSFVTTDDLRWQLEADYSVQTVGVSDKLGKPGTDTYKKWHDVVLQYRKGVPPKYGAIWLTYYPHVMVEWYPHVLVVSTLHPQGPDKTLNVVEFFYPEEICAFEREFIEAQQAAYMETCVEDDEIALRMDAGRKALMLRGDNEFGPYQSPMEDGMQHFHEWYRREMGASKTTQMI